MPEIDFYLPLITIISKPINSTLRLQINQTYPSGLPDGIGRTFREVYEKWYSILQLLL